MTRATSCLSHLTVGDLLQSHLRGLPAFRALLRAVEARFYRDLPMPAPVLDLGCGDGHFASLAFGTLKAGLDPWRQPLREAFERGAHEVLAQADGGAMPYPAGYFGTVVSNSVLEHIRELPPVLSEVARVLQPGGWFLFCVPGPSFLPFLSLGRGLDRIGLRGVGARYRYLFNRISRHHHCDPPEVWESRLEAAGLELERSWAYFSREALTALELGHYLGLPSLVSKVLAGRWILWPSPVNLWLTERLVRPYYEEALSQPPTVKGCDGGNREAIREGAYLFLVARKPESGPADGPWGYGHQ